MNSRGSGFLRKFRAGKRLTRAQAIQAKCADCTGEYTDGRKDCGIGTCPLYPFSPYRGVQNSTGVGGSVLETYAADRLRA